MIREANFSIVTQFSSCVLTHFHKIVIVFDEAELLAHQLHPAKINVAVVVHESVSFVQSDLLCSCGSCEYNSLLHYCLSETLPSALPPWKCRLVSWHAATYLASLSLSLSLVVKESSPMSPLHRCHFILKT